jgi:quercetin dioxygenase-like cupin family protein
MGVGIYLLPKGGSGETLTHDFDKFKITTRGGGRFDISGDGFETQPGAIALIKDDEAHFG